MNGLIGGTLSESTAIDALVETDAAADSEPVVRSRGEFTLCVSHLTDRDATGWGVHDADGITGVRYGAIPGIRGSDEEEASFFRGLLEDPAETLARADGPFAVACTDGEELVVASDKLGTRPIQYADGDDPGEDLVFGSNLAEVAATLDRPSVDERAVSDLLLIGHVWGEKTLLDQVTYLSPATVLRYDGAETDRQEYWAPTFDTRPRTSFGQNVASAYRSCLGDAASTMDDASVSMWLSGGLDSRAMVGELAERFPDMRTFTYDANPSGGGNLRIARDVADTLGIANETVDLTPGPLVEHFEDAVTLTDGMLGWKTFLNLTASFAVEDPGDVLLEACGQGGMMGDGIGRAAIELSSSPADALYRAKHKVDAETVETLLSGDADPMITYQQAVDGVDQDGYAETVLGAYYRNYFPRGDFASNKLVRARTGTRVPLAHGEFLDAVTKMPLKCRVGWVPGTRGAVPYGTAAAKLGLVRRLDSALDSIPYERTKVAPERPLWQHAAGFVFHTGIRRLRGETTYGGRRMASAWSITNDDLRTLLVGLLEDAADRPFLDADAVETVVEEHFETEAADRIGAVSGIATLEQWLQSHYDPHT
ncbi:asparagine synthase-related protein [Halobaculum halobium]|uniref:Asparagine synthase-related protein n=1 Tax=Halobaculum halobium TaxID=3032281 RepID=A0ABD5T7P9_9EURY|nr:asparagine synthase-related protein [Halobaculum sp. SYNS20]